MFGVLGLGMGDWGVGFRVWGAGFRVQDLGLGFILEDVTLVGVGVHGVEMNWRR